VLRTIDGFHRDEHGDWVADLSCLHAQHVRHQPPFRDRAWVLTAAGRADHVGTSIECPLCDRGELPAGLHVVRTIGPFDDETLPAGLRRDHRVAERIWAVLRVLGGTLRFTMATDPAVDRVLGSGDIHAIPPDVAHAVHPQGRCRVTIDFMTRGDR
jgi:tellurite methyltransferase